MNLVYIFNANQKYKLLVKRLKRIIVKAIKYIIISLNASDFEILGTEIAFDDKKGDYKPILISLENGKQIEIIGKIDRVDIAKNEDGKFIRIIDYKSSIHNLDFSEVYGGLQLQLITYLDAMCKTDDFTPAGILYFNLLEDAIKLDKRIKEEEIEEKIRMQFKMKGLILADVKVVKMQDKNLEAGMSEIIPAYIDKTGDEIITCSYNDVYSFCEGLAKVEKDGKYGFIDKNGYEVVSCIYDKVDDFREGLAGVCREGKCGFIDKSGNEVIPLKYDDVKSLTGGLLKVGINNNENRIKYGIIDKTGMEIVPCKYGGIEDLQEGLYRVAENGWGCIDKSGNEVIPCFYDNLDDFGDGLAFIRKGEYVGYIDKEGKRALWKRK